MIQGPMVQWYIGGSRVPRLAFHIGAVEWTEGGNPGGERRALALELLLYNSIINRRRKT